ncbi:S8 family serine peptidase [Aliagarivorans taiwanensis]|uniref:S8 family serine peptidase n=1 Tax=Aliagarivorans taiwanensis TaxID=561966 RepID=UPI000425C83F|nr:S8 family serine peptidase [Aliagarivorans taiwanensis]
MKGFTDKLLVMALTCLLAACGGGGGGDGGGDGGTPVTEPEGLFIDSSQNSSVVNDSVEFRAISLTGTFSDQTISWDFGDGTQRSIGATSLVQHSYAQDGTYQVSASYTSAQGLEQAQLQITVFNDARYDFGGEIQVLPNTIVDSDINDPVAEHTENNTLQDAQPVPPVAVISGYITDVATGNSRDRFYQQADPSDYFRVDLQAGQRVFLEIAEWETGDVDFDLQLLDESGNWIDQSIGVNKTENLSVTETGSYYVRVYSYEGSGNYTLRLISQNSNTVLPEGHYSTQQDFMLGEAVALSGAPATLARSNGYNAMELVDLDLPVARSAVGDKQAKLTTLLAIKQLHHQGKYQQVSPNFMYQAFEVPNDPLYDRQWHYQAIKLEQAWELQRLYDGGYSPVVAVLDTGIYQSHDDLTSVLSSDGFDFISDPSNALDGDGFDNNPEDPGDSPNGSSSWHGTHVAGTVAAESDNNLGVAGVSRNTEIMNLRVLGRFGGSTWDISQAMLYAAGLSNASGQLPTRAARVINMSLGGSGYDPAFDSVTQQVIGQGVVVVAAAGSESTSSPSYPAAFDNVISVSATAADNTLAYYSNYGSSIDVAAPGGDTSRDLIGDGYGDGVYSTYVAENSAGRSQSYAYLNGTSMAAPHVAGVIALMMTVDETLDAATINDLLAQGELTQDIGSVGRDNLYGYGLIDAEKAINTAADSNGVPGRSYLRFDVNQLALDLAADSASFNLSRVGDAALSVTSISASADWMSVTAVTVDGDGLGDYRVQVNRDGLADGVYQGLVNVVASDASELSLSVSMLISSVTAGDSGLVYVTLVDVNGYQDTQQIVVQMVDGRFTYLFEQVQSGEYEIYASSDNDNDFELCDEGELCGAYPLINEMETVLLESDALNINFTLSPITTEDYGQQQLAEFARY